ncbi:MAG: glycosyltransferase family A protein [Candidatus Levyibacteriota bacterium]
MQKKIKPTVSILLPVHNSEKHLTDCLRSLLKQTYRPIEIIAIDDSSTDNSYKILLKFKKRDKRVRVYKNIKRYGYEITLNRLFTKTKGQFIGFADADDIFEKEKIKKQHDFLLENPQVVAVGTQCRFINEANKRIGKSNYPAKNRLIYQNPLHGISLQFETLLINRYNLPKDVLKVNTNSHPFTYSDFLMKLLPYGKFANLTQYLYLHRRNPQDYFSDIKQNLLSLAKLWIKSAADYDYRPSIRSVFGSVVKTS